MAIQPYLSIGVCGLLAGKSGTGTLLYGEGK